MKIIKILKHYHEKLNIIIKNENSTQDFLKKSITFDVFGKQSYSKIIITTKENNP